MLARWNSPRTALRRHLTADFYDPHPGAYDVMAPPPSELIDASGSYPAGWYTEPPATLNLDRTKAGWRRLHRWFFLHFDSEDLFIGANLIDLRFGGNAGIVELNKRTGEFTVHSATGLAFNNEVKISEDCREFRDEKTDSFVRITSDDQNLSFKLDIHGVTFEGEASALFDRPFVQSTRLDETLGTLQMWGNLTLDSGRLIKNGVTRELSPGLYGAYDRSVGHRRLLENWNWIVACGEAVHGVEAVPFALHAAADRSDARPRVDGRKSALWVGNRFVKITDLVFEYEYTDQAALKTTPWRVHSSKNKVHWVDLVFHQQFHRRDTHRIPLLFNVDHSQYFGEITGEVCVDGKVHDVAQVFATTEDSRMVI